MDVDVASQQSDQPQVSVTPISHFSSPSPFTSATELNVVQYFENMSLGDSSYCDDQESQLTTATSTTLSSASAVSSSPSVAASGRLSPSSSTRFSYQGALATPTPPRPETSPRRPPRMLELLPLAVVVQETVIVVAVADGGDGGPCVR